MSEENKGVRITLQFQYSDEWKKEYFVQTGRIINELPTLTFDPAELEMGHRETLVEAQRRGIFSGFQPVSSGGTKLDFQQFTVYADNEKWQASEGYTFTRTQAYAITMLLNDLQEFMNKQDTAPPWEEASVDVRA